LISYPRPIFEDFFSEENMVANSKPNLDEVSITSPKKTDTSIEISKE